MYQDYQKDILTMKMINLIHIYGASQKDFFAILRERIDSSLDKNWSNMMQSRDIKSYWAQL